MTANEAPLDGSTHWDGTETGFICHDECAIAEIRRLRAERAALRADAERIHGLLQKATAAKTWGDAQAAIDAAAGASEHD